MAQDILIDPQKPETTGKDSPLIVCKDCSKLVPKTNLCLYCGAPILYKQAISTI